MQFTCLSICLPDRLPVCLSVFLWLNNFMYGFSVSVALQTHNSSGYEFCLISVEDMEKLIQKPNTDLRSGAWHTGPLHCSSNQDVCCFTHFHVQNHQKRTNETHFVSLAKPLKK